MNLYIAQDLYYCMASFIDIPIKVKEVAKWILGRYSGSS